MKKRILCVVLSVILCMLSLNVFPMHSVHATESTSDSIILYEKIFLGINEEYTFELQFDIDYYLTVGVS